MARAGGPAHGAPPASADRRSPTRFHRPGSDRAMCARSPTRRSPWAGSARDSRSCPSTDRRRPSPEDPPSADRSPTAAVQSLPTPPPSGHSGSAGRHPCRSPDPPPSTSPSPLQDTNAIEQRTVKQALNQLEQHPEKGTHTMVRLLARILGIGIETADMLVHEVLSRNLRDRRAVARYAGLTGAPDESGGRRREK